MRQQSDDDFEVVGREGGHASRIDVGHQGLYYSKLQSSKVRLSSFLSFLSVCFALRLCGEQGRC
jgi:hypothetical protein